MPTNEIVRKIACKVFSLPFFPSSIERKGSRFLLAPLIGPELKSYWPLRKKDIIEFWNNKFSYEVPLPGAMKYAEKLKRHIRILPISHFDTYKIYQSKFRTSRGMGSSQKNESRQTITKIGNVTGGTKRK